MKKIVVKVVIACEKCKTLVMATIAKLEGIKSITVDAEKNTVTVVGTVDPVCIVTALKKKKRPAQIESVGPVQKEIKINDPCTKLPQCCTPCSRVPPRPYGVIVWTEEPKYGCIIL